MVTSTKIKQTFVAAIFVMGFLYGVFVLLFCITLCIALGPESRRFSNRRLIVWISSLMLLFSTTHLVIHLMLVIPAVTESGDLLASGPAHSPLDMANTCIYLVQIMLGDGVLAWRSYVLYNRKALVIIPGSLILLLDAVILLTMARLGIPIDSSQGIHATWLLIFLASSICLHSGYTGCIALKIYRVTNHDLGSQKIFKPVLRAVLESGVIYTVTAMAMLACTVTGAPGHFVLETAVPQLVGICFCLMVLQIHVHYTKNGGSTSSVGLTATIPWRQELEDLTTEPHIAPRREATPGTTTIKGGSESTLIEGTP